MGDVAASGGYYMAMGAKRIVAENLTVTGSIGVVAGKFSLQNLYDKIGYDNLMTITIDMSYDVTSTDSVLFQCVIPT